MHCLKLNQIARIAAISVLIFASLSQIQIITESADEEPVARAGHELVYHDRLQMVLLINGELAQSEPAGTSGKIWGWNGQQWVIVNSNGPVSRSLGGVAYDSKRDVLVIYGGYSNQQCRTDTWEWDGTEWRELDVAGPGVCDHFSMTFDSERGKVVLFGGQDKDIRGFRDTWEWDGVSWAKVGTTGPLHRVHYAMTYDSSRHRVLIFGGRAGNAELNDLWAWDGSTWLQIDATGPSTRGASRMTFDSTSGETILFGGSQSFNSLNDTWKLENSNNSDAWTLLSNNGPSRLGYHSMAYDPVLKKVILFGGYDSQQNLLGDTWEWDGQSWTQVN